MQTPTLTLPYEGATLAVKMPCGNEALAEVLAIIRSAGRYQPISVRVKWLPANGGYMRGYRLVWGKSIETTETSLPWPPDPNEMSYGARQLGEYRVLEVQP